MNSKSRRLLLMLLVAGATSSCMFKDLRHQQQQLDGMCLISGTVAAEAPARVPRVVVLLGNVNGSWQVKDRFITEGDGRWLMVAQPGSYTIAAFEDPSRDSVYQPGEPALKGSHAVNCAGGARLEDLNLKITADNSTLPHGIDITHSRDSITAVGTITTLQDSRFADENVKAGIWTPYDFLVKTGAGVYFLEPYDPAKTPVLFVHGMGGSPRDFRSVIEKLDTKAFQPWVYYYPSGAGLHRLAEHLDETMSNIELKYSVPSFVVVAHSMGGLVAREFLLMRQGRRASAKVLSFVTVSTPWAGHNGARIGLTLAPTPVPSWIDMAPESDYLSSLFSGGRTGHRSLDVPYYLLFSYKKSAGSFGESNDGVVSVASELRAEAQQEAAGMYGFNDSHEEILDDPAAARLIFKLVQQHTELKEVETVTHAVIAPGEMPQFDLPDLATWDGG